jgi:hypothetical protein
MIEINSQTSVVGISALIPNTIKGSRNNCGYFTVRCLKGTLLSWVSRESPSRPTVAQHIAQALDGIEEQGQTIRVSLTLCITIILDRSCHFTRPGANGT